jgi:hypothetical protein
MTTPRPHAHAEAWITQWHYRDDRSEQQRHGFAGAQLWWSENSWPDAIRYPAATAVDPGERN